MEIEHPEFVGSPWVGLPPDVPDELLPLARPLVDRKLVLDPSHGEVVRRHECDADKDLEFQGTISAPGYGNAWACRTCGAPWTQVGDTYFRPDEEDGEPSNILTLGDVM